MRKSRRFALAFTGCAAIIAAAFAIASHAPSAAPAPMASSRVIAVRYGGKFTTLKIRDGDRVFAGEVIAVLDTAELKKRMEAARRDLQRAQEQSGFIQPMLSLPGLAGFLPKQVPPEEIVSVHIPAEPPKTAGATPSPLVAATAAQKAAAVRLRSATDASAKAEEGLEVAQRDRDGLVEKQIALAADLADAEKKLGTVKQLFDAGAASKKEVADAQDVRDAAKKASDLLNLRVSAADEALAAAKSRREVAQREAIASAEALKQADEVVTAVAKAKPAPAPITALSKPVKSAKIVSRRMALHVRTAPPPLPVKVVVDEKAMQSSEQGIAALKQRIQDLQAKIDEAVVRAPAAGVVHISTSGEITIAAE